MFLSSFPAVYSELLKLFDVREVANLVQDTLGSLPTIMHVDDSLQAIKLQCISKTVESQLYTNPGRVGSGFEKILGSPKGVAYILEAVLSRSSETQKAGKYFLKSMVVWMASIFTSQM